MYMAPRRNKFKKFDYIKLDKLYVGRSNVRTENVVDEEELDSLAEHINQHGLLEPIVVFEVNSLDKKNELYDSRLPEFKDKFEILAGQRRWNAFQKLNKDNPGQDWDTIPCHIRDPPENEADAKAISLGEGLTQLPFTLADIIDACTSLFNTYNDERIVAKKTGISTLLVKRYVKFHRLPELLQENLDTIYPKAQKTAVNLAVEAADALDYIKDGDVSPEKVLELAQKLGEKKKKSQDEYKKMKQAAEENPKLPVKKMEEEATKIMNPKRYSVLLKATIAKKLDDAAEEHGKDPDEEAADIIEAGLKTRQSRAED